MKEKTKTVQKPSDQPHDLFKRFKLETLDQFECEKQGYNPYDTSPGRVPDIWATKRKRA